MYLCAHMKPQFLIKLSERHWFQFYIKSSFIYEYNENTFYVIDKLTVLPMNTSFFSWLCLLFCNIFKMELLCHLLTFHCICGCYFLMNTL